MALPPHAPLVLLAAIAGSGLGFFLWLYRDTPGAKPLAVMMFAASVWSLAEGLQLASSGLETKLFWTRVLWSVSPIVPLAWLATVLAYTGNEGALTRRRLAALVAEPTAFVALVWTSEVHDLVWESTGTAFSGSAVVLTETFGLAFWAHVAYSYGLILAGAALLVRMSFRTNRLFRGQSTALLGAIFVPLVANAASIFHLVPPTYDLTSVGFVFTGVVLTVGLLKGKLMTVSPSTRELGRETLIDELDDQVLIVDEDDSVVDVNPAAADLFGIDHGDVVGRDLSEVDPDLARAVADVGEGQTALSLHTDGDRRHFDVRVSELYRSYGVAAGRLVSLRDVTGRERREQRLDVLNRLLRHNLRNEMNVVSGNAELLAEELQDLDDGARKRIERIRSTVDTVVERSDKVGRLSRLVDDDATGGMELAPVCETIAGEVRAAHPGASIEVDVPGSLAVDAGPSIRFAIEEVLENAVEHNDGDRPAVVLSATESDDGFVAVEVSDDGPGMPEQERSVIEAGRETDLEHGSGVGLWLVAWVVRANGGRLAFENHADDGDRAATSGETGERGCTVRIALPPAPAASDRQAPRATR